MADRVSEPNRKRRIAYEHPGDAHALTFSVFRRFPILSEPALASLVGEGIAAAAEKLHFDVWAYVVMPEHVHVLIHPRGEHYRIGQILSAIKARSAQQILQARPELREKLSLGDAHGKIITRVWQRGGGYDQNVRTGQAAWSIIRYIHWNPVKRGLCGAPENWKFSSAGDYLDVPGLIPVVLCPWNAT